MEDRGGEHGAGVTVADAFDEVGEVADAAAGDHRHADRIGHRTRQRQIVADLRSIAIHRGEQDFARAEADQFFCVLDRIDAGALSAAMGEDFEFVWRHLLGVDGGHDALAAEFFRSLADEFRAAHGFGVDAHLVGAREQEAANIIERAHAAAHGERHETDFRGAAHHIEQDAALFMRGGDIEEAEFIGARRIIEHRLFDGIARIAQVDEVHALDDAAILHIQTGNDADLEHRRDILSGPWPRC